MLIVQESLESEYSVFFVHMDNNFHFSAGIF